MSTEFKLSDSRLQRCLNIIGKNDPGLVYILINNDEILLTALYKAIVIKRDIDSFTLLFLLLRESLSNPIVKLSNIRNFADLSSKILTADNANNAFELWSHERLLLDCSTKTYEFRTVGEQFLRKAVRCWFKNPKWETVVHKLLKHEAIVGIYKSFIPTIFRYAVHLYKKSDVPWKTTIIDKLCAVTTGFGITALRVIVPVHARAEQAAIAIMKSCEDIADNILKTVESKNLDEYISGLIHFTASASAKVIPRLQLHMAKISSHIERKHFISAVEKEALTPSICLLALGAVKNPLIAVRALIAIMLDDDTNNLPTWNYLPALRKVFKERTLDIRYLSLTVLEEHGYHHFEESELLMFSYNFDSNVDDHMYELSALGGNYEIDTQPNDTDDTLVRLACFWSLKVHPSLLGRLTKRVLVIANVVRHILFAIGKKNVSNGFMTKLIAEWL